MHDDPILTTERVLLRAMAVEDAGLLRRIFSDPVAMQHYPGTKDDEETLRWIEWTQLNYKEHGIGLWIVQRRADGAFLGQCGLVPQTVDGTFEVEIGYLFVREHWHQGYATEAAAACRDWGFLYLSVQRLISLIAPKNAPSRRVATRVGMHLDRRTTSRHGFPINVFSIQREDWEDGSSLAN